MLNLLVEKTFNLAMPKLSRERAIKATMAGMEA